MIRYRKHHRRGSIYIAVLASALLVTVLGLSAILVARLQVRADQWTGDLTKARLYAHSAVQMAFLHISSDPDWRTNFPNGTWIADQTINDGTLTLEVTDPGDGDLTDSPTDPVVVTGIGQKGQARHKVQVTLVADTQPLEVLNTCLHAAGKVTVTAGKSITVIDMPLSTNGELQKDGLVDGDVEAGSISGGGIITGETTVPASPKQMPDAGIFETYRLLATTVPNPQTIDMGLLTPGSNPFGGGLNADGVYFIDTAGGDLLIRDSRIHGTLVVRCSPGKVQLDTAVLLHNYRAGYPALIVDGGVEILLDSGIQTLKEEQVGNMNPPDSPYNDVSDGDTDDVYPNEIQGLVHVKGALLINRSALIRGAVICESTVVFDDDTLIIHLPSLYSSPPQGYTYMSRMKVSPGTWRQTVD